MQAKSLTLHAALLASLAAMPAAHAVAQNAGQTTFQNNCASCHSVDAKLTPLAGPGLHRVLGRKAASVPGYNYSAALTKAGAAGKTWTRAELDVFLADPAKNVPGTTMPVGISDKKARAALIDYLASLQGPAVAAAAASAPAAKTALERRGSWDDSQPGRIWHLKASDLPPPFATSSAGNGPRVEARPNGSMPTVPKGFTVGVFAQDADKPRLLLRAPNGDIFLAATAKGEVKVLRAKNGEKADNVETFASGLTRPYGMAFWPSNDNPQYLYVANVNSVVRIPYRNGDLKARGEAEVIVPTLSETSGGHTTRTLAFSSDDKTLLLSIGSATNVATEIGAKPPEPLAQWEAKHGFGGAWGVETDRATVMAFDPDGKNRRTYATGLRNCVGMLVYPGTGDVMCNVNERDALGDNLPPDYLTRVKQGGFYGWPWYYIGDNEDPRLKGHRPDLKGKAIVPDVLIQPHSAPLGMAVYQAPKNAANAFPKEYEGDVFVALHGSWNRGVRTGYKVVRVFMKNGVPTGQYQDFMSGMVLSDRDVWGRPAGVAVAQDGALLVVDDAGGVVWRIAPQR
ncbi:PQQ-dependent sugar dehydrogenase [Massilia sp. G4R7]|uniref:PQQ-dependent sugar dehydrogenase n=1 Tax=Massilia phyllostachyos TaxID=2898585 RepID=A0ABS8Q050_9BURK|nr:PQQ-dependent sugar dehydrogenase [Massilia phyllostachyos]MCD2515128.1 PQQ-dependent sugar dehydrogenase [Massilia phyllostachyos]